MTLRDNQTAISVNPRFVEFVWRTVNGRPAWTALAIKRNFSTVALDVHLEDLGVVDQTIDGCQPREVGITPADNLVDKSLVSIETGEVARAPQQQRILQRSLEMSVGTLDRAVLVRDARIVARWRHAVMSHQRGVALYQILPRVGRQIAERRWQAVAAMLPRHAAERP